MDYTSFSKQDQQYQYQYQYQYEQQNQQPYDPTQYQPISVADNLSASSSQTQPQYSYSYSLNHLNQNDQQYPYNHYANFHEYYYSQSHQQQPQDPSVLQPPGVPPTLLHSDPNSGSKMPQFSDNLQIGQTPYRGGRRGNRPSRGGRGHFGHSGPRSSGPTPSNFRGRGRSRGGLRHLRPLGVALNSTPSNIAASGEASQPLAVRSQVPVVPPKQPPFMAFCDLCRVYCNSLEKLEQHKNGKKHKKMLLQVPKRLQKFNKDGAETQNSQMPHTEIKQDIIVQPENGHQGNDKILSDNNSEVKTNDTNNDTEEQCAGVVVVAQSEAPVEDLKMKQIDQIQVRGSGGKRKMRGGGRGGKFVRVSEGLRVSTVFPKQTQVVPISCDLCNIKCDTQAVFNAHLSGKKHQSNLKRVQSNRGFDPDPSMFVAPQSSNDPQLILAQLLMTYVRSQTQAQTQGQGSNDAAQNQANLNGQELDPKQPGQVDQSALAAEIRTRLQSLIAMCNSAAPASDTSDGAANGNSNAAAIATSEHVVHENNPASNLGEISGVSEQVHEPVSDKVLSSQSKDGPSDTNEPEDIKGD